VTRLSSGTIFALGSGAGTCVPNTPPNPAQITAGNQTKFNVYFHCTVGGSLTGDPVTISISKLPTGATFSPTTTTADTASTTGTTITITTTRSSTVGNYTLQVSGKGKVCTSYGSTTSYCAETFSIAPVIAITCASTSKVCPNLWWFNGASPQPTNYVTTLQATSGGTDYAWTITSGAQYAQFSNNSSAIDTGSKNTVVVVPSADPGDGPPPPVTVTVAVATKEGTVTSAPFTLNLRKPYELRPNSIADKSNTTYGYQTQIYYQILDQTGAVLPFPVPMNQHFAPGTLVNDYPGTNWTEPTNCGSTGACTQLYTPSNWYDLVEGAKTAGSVPTSQSPQSPRGSTPVDHWSGSWGVGGGNPGTGATVQTNTWQRFRDHARHTNIVSPPP
jgi:hypothetical protein